MSFCVIKMVLVTIENDYRADVSEHLCKLTELNQTHRLSKFAFLLIKGPHL